MGSALINNINLHIFYFFKIWIHEFKKPLICLLWVINENCDPQIKVHNVYCPWLPLVPLSSYFQKTVLHSTLLLLPPLYPWQGRHNQYLEHHVVLPEVIKILKSMITRCGSRIFLIHFSLTQRTWVNIMHQYFFYVVYFL
jgi:hypothetical protein